MSMYTPMEIFILILAEGEMEDIHKKSKRKTKTRDYLIIDILFRSSLYLHM